MLHLAKILVVVGRGRQMLNMLYNMNETHRRAFISSRYLCCETLIVSGRSVDLQEEGDASTATNLQVNGMPLQPPYRVRGSPLPSH
ncbi:hypothetical protein AXF42_Ash019837 [Apostasia shenzhenica]|uniref:Uncharacterized protein n=1 Tax=Apostasia shenzhenica TaxID=1088818 RepID=A0A2I0ARF7_9ASPA|nr:hypothetical protein AXF42_Ash019837 [Apostasia shenzhenica]